MMNPEAGSQGKQPESPIMKQIDVIKNNTKDVLKSPDNTQLSKFVSWTADRIGKNAITDPEFEEAFLTSAKSLLSREKRNVTPRGELPQPDKINLIDAVTAMEKKYDRDWKAGLGVTQEEKMKELQQIKQEYYKTLGVEGLKVIQGMLSSPELDPIRKKEITNDLASITTFWSNKLETAKKEKNGELASTYSRNVNAAKRLLPSEENQ